MVEKGIAIELPENDFVKALEYYENHLRLRDSLNFTRLIKEKEETDKIALFNAIEQRIKSVKSEGKNHTYSVVDMCATRIWA